MSLRGYFLIGIYQPKYSVNIGTLWRSAYQLGAAGIFTIGKRCPQQASDTVKAGRHIPYYEYDSFEDFNTHRPKDCPLVGIETACQELSSFAHPERVIYLLGAEDNGLPYEILVKCQHTVTIPSVRVDSYNVAVAGSIIMYDRFLHTREQDRIIKKYLPPLEWIDLGHHRSY